MQRSAHGLLFMAVLLSTESSVLASGHGPVFGLATPTNPKGGWSLDLSGMSRLGSGSGAMLRAGLGYGVTENLKLSLSAPAVLKTDAFFSSRMSAFTPMSGDFEGLAIWRFHRQDTGVGSRFESALIGGVLVPGPKDAGGALRNTKSGVGGLVGAVTGIASRSHYAWGGVTYQRYASKHGDQRPDLLFYSIAYAYRPPSWRRDNGWDWRIFGEMTGEKSGSIARSGLVLPRSESHQVFLGPTTLGVYKNYAVSAGVQFPAYRETSPLFPHERVRLAINIAYFF